MLTLGLPRIELAQQTLGFQEHKSSKGKNLSSSYHGPSHSPSFLTLESHLSSQQHTFQDQSPKIKHACKPWSNDEEQSKEKTLKA